MGMTITEKILAVHAGTERVAPGELINAKVDFLLANDITAPIAITEFKKIGASDVFDKSRVTFVPDHFAPQKDIQSAEQCRSAPKLKLVKMTVEPAHGILNGDVQLPKRIAGRHLDAPPNGRFGPL